MLSVQAQHAVSAVFRGRFLQATRDVALTQRETLLEILTANAGTWFGVRHNFAKIHSISDYQAAVPICSYQDVKELIQRIAAGEPNVLTRARVNYLQLTSGTTTGQQKLIPSTWVYQRKVWEAMLASQGFLHQWAATQQIQRGQGLMVVNAITTGITEGGIPFEPASANMARTARPIWRLLSVAPFETTQVVDPEARRYVHWRYALLAEKLRYIGSGYMSPLLTFASTLFHQSDELIRDIADGTLSSDLPLPTAQRKALTARLRPNRCRAAQLECMAADHGGLLPRAIWPELGWILTIYGPAFRSYESQLADRYGHKFVWGLTYLACEGIVGLPCFANSYTHLPAITATFFEFIPEEEWSNTNPLTCLVTELKCGGRYEVVLTGWNGLYRYRLGDVIEVDGVFNGLPTLKVVSRRSGVLSIVWEKTTEGQAVDAVTSCEADCGISFADFVVDIDQAVIPARYQLWVEPLRADIDINLELLQITFDSNLRRTNPSYNMQRNNEEIGAPIVRLLPKGTFEQLRRDQERKGTAAEQIKVLHLMRHWEYPISQDSK